MSVAAESTLRAKAGIGASVVPLLALAVFINYVDRGNLATATPLIQEELHLSASQLGVLLSAFYYGYVVCMPGMGWLAERYGAKRVLAAGVTVWSIATLMTVSAVRRLLRRAFLKTRPMNFMTAPARRACPSRGAGGATRAPRRAGRASP